ncbi:unnamed protein product, partial [Mesorhabditis spiculigera]
MGTKKYEIAAQSPKDGDEEEVEKKLEEVGTVQIPDGGYGWVIVAASFLANVVVDGVIFTAPASCTPLLKGAFLSSDSRVSLAHSLMQGGYLLSGPLASALSIRYGCRFVTIVGACVAAFGFVASTFADRIEIIYLTYGIIGGVGFGLMYLPAIVVISQYFSQKRAFATGLAVCGSGIGTSLFANLNSLVLQYTDNNWRYFFFYLAGCSLIGIISGLLYRPLQPTDAQVEQAAAIVEKYEKTKQIEHLEGDKANPEHPFLAKMEQEAEHQGGDKVWSEHEKAKEVAREVLQEVNNPLAKSDAFYPGSTSSLNQRERTASASAVDKEAFLRDTRRSQLSIASPKTGTFTAVKEFLKGMVDMEQMRRPSFLLLALSGFLTMTCFYVPFAFLGKHVDRVEAHSNETYTVLQKDMPITVLGFVNIGFRILCGRISDSPDIDSSLVSAIALMGAGSIMVAVPLFSHYWNFIAFTVPFAFGIACFAALRSVMCVDLWGTQKLSSSFGTLMLFMGFGALLGSPCAAIIKDFSGNFDLSFYVMGSLMVLSGLVCVPLKRIRAWEIERETRTAPVELQPLNA